jgi:hypothetical protein
MQEMIMGVNFHRSHLKQFLLSSISAQHIETALMMETFWPVLGDKESLRQ